MEKRKLAILYLDSHIQNLNAFKAHFRRCNYNIHMCKEIPEALKILKETPIDIMIAEHSGPASTGFEFLENEILKNHPVLISLSAERDTHALQKAVEEKKLFSFLDKPLKFESLERLIAEAIVFINLSN